MAQNSVRRIGGHVLALLIVACSREKSPASQGEPETSRREPEAPTLAARPEKPPAPPYAAPANEGVALEFARALYARDERAWRKFLAADPTQTLVAIRRCPTCAPPNDATVNKLVGPEATSRWLRRVRPIARPARAVCRADLWCRIEPADPSEAGIRITHVDFGESLLEGEIHLLQGPPAAVPPAPMSREQAVRLAVTMYNRGDLRPWLSARRTILIVSGGEGDAPDHVRVDAQRGARAFLDAQKRLGALPGEEEPDAACEDDGCCRLWDRREEEEPLWALGEHLVGVCFVMESGRAVVSDLRAESRL